MPRQSHLAYSWPLDPRLDSETWMERNHKVEREMVRSQQVHTCSRTTCLRLDKGQLICKRKAPWPLSEDDYVDERGNWGPKRTNSYINGYCPLILSYPYFSQSQLRSNLGLPDLSLGIDATLDLVRPSPAP